MFWCHFFSLHPVFGFEPLPLLVLSATSAPLNCARLLFRTMMTLNMIVGFLRFIIVPLWLYSPTSPFTTTAYFDGYIYYILLYDFHILLRRCTIVTIYD